MPPIAPTAQESLFYTDGAEGKVNIRQCDIALQLNLQRMEKNPTSRFNRAYGLKTSMRKR